MSDTYVYTPLAGYVGPFFTRELHEFHQKLYQYSSRHFSGLAIVQAFERSPRFRDLNAVKTNDQYHWPQAVTFEAYETTIRILLPFGTDFTQKDGTRSERHSALYTKTQISPILLRRFMVEVNRLWDQYLTQPT